MDEVCVSVFRWSVRAVVIGLLLAAGPAETAGARPQGTPPQSARDARVASDAKARTTERRLAAVSRVQATGTVPSAPAAEQFSGAPVLKPAPVLERERFPYYDVVHRVANRHGVDPSLVLAIIAVESGGNPAAVSSAGAIGLMQLMPATAKHLGVDPWNPVENIEGAVRYLASLRSTFKSIDASLVAYNAGPTFAARYVAGKADLGAETRVFLMRVGQLLPRGVRAGGSAPGRRP